MSEEIELPELTVTLAEDLQQANDEEKSHENEESDTDTDSEENEETEQSDHRDTRAEKRIAKLNWQRLEERNRANQAEREAQELRATIDRLAQQSGEEGQETDPALIQQFIREEAIKLQEESAFNAQCNKIYAEGKKEFPGFDEAVGNLQMVGMNKEFLEAVSTSDMGHKILNYLGNDLEKAEYIASLPPIQMVREITKLEAQLSNKTKPISRVPAPIKPLSTSGTPGTVSADNTAEWIAQRNKQKLGR